MSDALLPSLADALDGSAADIVSAEKLASEIIRDWSTFTKELQEEVKTDIIRLRIEFAGEEFVDVEPLYYVISLVPPRAPKFRVINRAGFETLAKACGLPCKGDAFDHEGRPVPTREPLVSEASKQDNHAFLQNGAAVAWAPSFSLFSNDEESYLGLRGGCPDSSSDDDDDDDDAEVSHVEYAPPTLRRPPLPPRSTMSGYTTSPSSPRPRRQALHPPQTPAPRQAPSGQDSPPRHDLPLRQAPPPPPRTRQTPSPPPPLRPSQRAGLLRYVPINPSPLRQTWSPDDFRGYTPGVHHPAVFSDSSGSPGPLYEDQEAAPDQGPEVPATVDKEYSEHQHVEHQEPRNQPSGHQNPARRTPKQRTPRGRFSQCKLDEGDDDGWPDLRGGRLDDEPNNSDHDFEYSDEDED